MKFIKPNMCRFAPSFTELSFF